MRDDPYANKARLYAAVVDRLNRSLHAVAFKAHPVVNGMRVLDVGCGTGAQLEWYLQAGCSVAGIDLSPAMLARARTRLGPDVDLRVGDAADLPHGDADFDLVVASMFLHELSSETIGAVLSEAARVLDAAGAMVIVDFGAGGLTASGRARRFISRLFERAAGRQHFANHVAFLARGGVPAVLNDSPLRLESERLLAGGDLSIVVARHRRHVEGGPTTS